jgi:hypothetical protein
MWRLKSESCHPEPQVKAPELIRGDLSGIMTLLGGSLRALDHLQSRVRRAGADLGGSFTSSMAWDIEQKTVLR